MSSRFPQVLLDLIDDYVQAFDLCESLPEVSAIRTLINKSNKNLCKVATQMLELPHQIMIDISLDLDHEIFRNDVIVSMLDDIVSISLMTNFSTPALFWLFVQKTPTLYFGPYGVLFEQSLLFKMINIITSA